MGGYFLLDSFISSDIGVSLWHCIVNNGNINSCEWRDFLMTGTQAKMLGQRRLHITALSYSSRAFFVESVFYTGFLDLGPFLMLIVDSLQLCF